MPGAPASAVEVQNRSIWQLLEESVAARPDTRMVFSVSGQEKILTLAELRVRALHLAQGLHRRGMKAGDVVVVQLPHCPENTVLFFACMALGIVVAPVVHNYGPAETGFMLRQTGARMLFMPSRWHNFDYPERARTLAGIDTLREIVFIGIDGYDGLPDCPKAVAWKDVVAENGMEGLPAVDPEAPCVIIYTSGTTSAPKGAMHCHRSLIAEGTQTSTYIDFLEHRALLQAAPAGHIGPISSVMRQLLFGMDLVHIDRWDVDIAVQLVQNHSVGWSIGVPIFLADLIDAKEQGRLPTFDTFMVGGTNVPPALVRRADAVGIRACRSYGSTEHPTVAQGHVSEPLAKRAWTDGCLMPGCKLRLLDEQGREAPPGQPGEIVTTGDELFMGYFDRSLNDAAFTPDGWYRTGDIGVVDKDGFLEVVDRKKDIIIRGGENISSKEIEDALSSHPAVMEAAAVGWPDAAMGERVGAFVKLRRGAALDMAEVQRHFREAGMAKIKTPEHLVIIEGDFPRNPSGKVMKTELRARAKRSAQ